MSSKLVQLLRGKSSERIMLHLVAGTQVPYVSHQRVCLLFAQASRAQWKKAHSLFPELEEVALRRGERELWHVVDLTRGRVINRALLSASPPPRTLISGLDGRESVHFHVELSSRGFRLCKDRAQRQRVHPHQAPRSSNACASAIRQGAEAPSPVRSPVASSRPARGSAYHTQRSSVIVVLAT